MMKFSLGKFQALILVFSQALIVQILFYPLVVFNIIRYLPGILTNKKIIFGFFLISYATISIFMRGASIELTIILLRFYCGIILVYTAFTINKNLQITHVSFWLFALFVFYEYISLLLGVNPFSYTNFINTGIELEIEGRVSLGGNVVRPFGPTMNSSVSGSILAIMLFYILIGSNNFLLFKRKNLLLLVGLFMAFVLCGSATAMIIFLFLLLVYVISGRKIPNRKSSPNFFPKLMAISLMLLIFTIISAYIFSDFIAAVLDSKLSYEYFAFIVSYKLFQITEMLDIKTFLFGADLAASSAKSSGGDFIMLSFVYHFGIIYVITFLVYLFYICKTENRVFLFAAMLSAMHYGTLFTLTGQAFFGALIAGSVFSNEFHRNRVKLKDLKIVKP